MRKIPLMLVFTILILTSFGCTDTSDENAEYNDTSYSAEDETVPSSTADVQFVLPSEIINESGTSFTLTIETLTKAINSYKTSETILPEKSDEWIEYPDINTSDGIAEFVWRADAKAYLSPSIQIFVNDEGYITEIRTDRSEETMTEKGVADFKIYSQILFYILCNIEGNEATELIDTMCDEAHETLYGAAPISRLFNGICMTAYYNSDRCTLTFTPSKQ